MHTAALSLFSELPESWKELLSDSLEQPYVGALSTFVEHAYRDEIVYPPRPLLFSAFNHCSPANVKVVILGQDPYHGAGEANGLCFSVHNGVKMPPSLRNIFKEVASDTEQMLFPDTDLSRWAKQGVFLLNSTLTVRKDRAASHQGKGWEQFTDEVIRKLSNQYKDIVFMLWGKYAWQKEHIIDANSHLILKAVHPSPLSAYRGFFGSNHFTQANSYLECHGRDGIDWR